LGLEPSVDDVLLEKKGEDEGATGGQGGEVSTGGADGGGMGGASSTGGEPGTLPIMPCALNCPDPYLIYRAFEWGVPLTTFTTFGGSVQRSTEEVYRGLHSMEFLQGQPMSEAEIRDPLGTRSSGALHLRAWVFIPEGAVTDWLKIVAFNAGTTAGIDVNIHASGEVEVSTVEPAQSAFSEQHRAVFGEWFCLQVAVDLSDTQGSVTASVDETPAVTLAPADTLATGSISRVVYGIAATGSNQVGGAIYLDELVIATEAVGCSEVVQ